MELPNKWVVKIYTQEQFDKVLEKLCYPNKISSGYFDEDASWYGIDSLMEYSDGEYYEKNNSFTIISFEDFMLCEILDRYPTFEMDGKWVVQCKTQDEWDEVLRKHNPEQLSSDDFEDCNNIDMHGCQSSIDYYKNEESDYRIIPAAEFLSITGPLKNAYSIF